MPTREEIQLDNLIAEVTGNAEDDSAAVSAFNEKIQAALKVPVLCLVLGDRVQLEGVELPNARRGIVALLRKDGRSQQVSLLDVLLPGKSRGALLIRAYQRWAGAPPMVAPAPSARATVSIAGDVMEAVVLKTGSETARLRPLGEDQEVTFRGSGSEIWRIVPGQIVTLKLRKRWGYRQYHYVSGHIEASRIDVAALGLRPFTLREHGPVDPGQPYGKGFQGLWERVASGSDVAFEVPRIVPGLDDDGSLEDPLFEAAELKSAGARSDAEKVLMVLLHTDLRCIDAHALLGDWTFDTSFDFDVPKALCHYEVGYRIGEHALGADFNARLPWGLPYNRPLLRCLYGYGLALWRRGQAAEALTALERLCVLNPTDEPGARFAWKAVRDGLNWSEFVQQMHQTEG